MLYNYIAILVFALIALFVPFSMLLLAKMLRHNVQGNPVKQAPYESGEATIGKNRDVINEYLPFFMMFLPFEVVMMMLLIWSFVSRQVPYSSSLLIIGMSVMSLAFVFLGYFMIRGRDAGK